MVLLRHAGPDGFTFYTNYESRKASELERNPRAALVFYWRPLGRQVRIEGSVARVSAADSDAYFESRPGGRRLSSAASPQSRPVPTRAHLEDRVAELSAMHPDGAVPRPEHWGGYIVTPAAVEFWQNDDDRLHDRVRYEQHADGIWTRERLAP